MRKMIEERAVEISTEPVLDDSDISSDYYESDFNQTSEEDAADTILSKLKPQTKSIRKISYAPDHQKLEDMVRSKNNLPTTQYLVNVLFCEKLAEEVLQMQRAEKKKRKEMTRQEASRRFWKLRALRARKVNSKKKDTTFKGPGSLRHKPERERQLEDLLLKRNTLKGLREEERALVRQGMKKYQTKMKSRQYMNFKSEKALEEQIKVDLMIDDILKYGFRRQSKTWRARQQNFKRAELVSKPFRRAVHEHAIHHCTTCEQRKFNKLVVTRREALAGVIAHSKEGKMKQQAAAMTLQRWWREELELKHLRKERKKHLRLLKWQKFYQVEVYLNSLREDLEAMHAFRKVMKLTKMTRECKEEVDRINYHFVKAAEGGKRFISIRAHEDGSEHADKIGYMMEDITNLADRYIKLVAARKQCQNALKDHRDAITEAEMLLENLQKQYTHSELKKYRKHHKKFSKYAELKLAKMTREDIQHNLREHFLSTPASTEGVREFTSDGELENKIRKRKQRLSNKEWKEVLQKRIQERHHKKALARQKKMAEAKRKREKQLEAIAAAKERAKEREQLKKLQEKKKRRYLAKKKHEREEKKKQAIIAHKEAQLQLAIEERKRKAQQRKIKMEEKAKLRIKIAKQKNDAASVLQRNACRWFARLELKKFAASLQVQRVARGKVARNLLIKKKREASKIAAANKKKEILRKRKEEKEKIEDARRREEARRRKEHLNKQEQLLAAKLLEEKKRRMEMHAKMMEQKRLQTIEKDMKSYALIPFLKNKIHHIEENLKVQMINVLDKRRNFRKYKKNFESINGIINTVALEKDDSTKLIGGLPSKDPDILMFSNNRARQLMNDSENECLRAEAQMEKTKSELSLMEKDLISAISYEKDAMARRGEGSDSRSHSMYHEGDPIIPFLTELNVDTFETQDANDSVSQHNDHLNLKNDSNTDFVAAPDDVRELLRKKDEIKLLEGEWMVAQRELKSIKELYVKNLQSEEEEHKRMLRIEKEKADALERERRLLHERRTALYGKNAAL